MTLVKHRNNIEDYSTRKVRTKIDEGGKGLKIELNPIRNIAAESQGVFHLSGQCLTINITKCGGFYERIEDGLLMQINGII